MTRLATQVRLRKKYVSTDSPTPRVKPGISKRINATAAIFFVLVKNYPQALTASQVREELKRDGIEVKTTNVNAALDKLSGRTPYSAKSLGYGKYKVTFRDELKCLKPLRGETKVRYKFNPNGRIRVKSVLGINRTDRITKAKLVKR